MNGKVHNNLMKIINNKYAKATHKDTASSYITKMLHHLYVTEKDNTTLSHRVVATL